MMERGILVRDFGTSIKEVNLKDSGTNQVTLVAIKYIPSASIFLPVFHYLSLYLKCTFLDLPRPDCM